MTPAAPKVDTSGETTPIFEQLRDERRDLWDADARWDDDVNAQPPVWGLGPTALDLLIDQISAELSPEQVRLVRAELEVRQMVVASDWMHDLGGEVSGGNDDDRPVHDPEVDHGSCGSEVVGRDGPGDPHDQS